MSSAKAPWQNWRRRLAERQQRWFQRRQPLCASETFGLRNIYIFPTRHGFMFIALIAVCWITGTNYENNLVLAIAFMLFALWLSAMYLTYLNVEGLRLDGATGDPVFAGETATLHYRLYSAPRQGTGRIQLDGPLDSAIGDLNADARATFVLSQTAEHRGWLPPPLLRLISLYPLGLFRAFSKPWLHSSLLVYPAPVAAPRRPGGGADDGNRQSVARIGGGDLGGLDEWQPGQPRSRIAWNKYAAGRGLVMRVFEDPEGDARWICWDDYPDLGTEARLSAMCHEILAHRERPFGLRLPGATLELGLGDEHRHQALRLLALHGLDDAPAPGIATRQ